MKKVILALVMMSSASAFAGVAQQQQAGKLEEGCRMVTETVYDGGESGVDKRVVTYKLCPHKDIPQAVEICTGEGTPCVPTAWGIPQWLQALSDALPGDGQPVVHPGTSNGGPN